MPYTGTHFGLARDRAASTNWEFYCLILEFHFLKILKKTTIIRKNQKNMKNNKKKRKEKESRSNLYAKHI